MVSAPARRLLTLLMTVSLTILTGAMTPTTASATAAPSARHAAVPDVDRELSGPLPPGRSRDRSLLGRPR